MTPPLRRTPTDGFPTPTSKLQSETEEILIAHLPADLLPPSSQDHDDKKDDTGADDGPKKPAPDPRLLQKQNHMIWLAKNLRQGFPQRFTALDASQPWLLYWTLHALSLLQVGLDPGNKQRAIDKIMTWQHPDGGFGGGPGQAPHLLPTYAAICALAIVGRPGPGGGWDQIDRKKLYDFFMSLKQKDGSFLVSHSGEVDVRGIYCLLVVATLLNLLTPALLADIPTFLSSCQTYEGGFSCASHPSYDPAGNLLPYPLFPRPPLGEAHGGYTFCALASWVMVQPYMEWERLHPHSPPLPNPYSEPGTPSFPAYDNSFYTQHQQGQQQPTINIPNLTRWLVQMQGSEAELGGFKGRTNKLVDGCYAWWVGGAFALLEGLGLGVGYSEGGDEGEQMGGGAKEAGQEAGGGEGDWVDDDDPGTSIDMDIDALFNRTALQSYILFAGQHPAGGLRDKPPKPADSYHTLYCLSGLSAAQHQLVFDRVQRKRVLDFWVASRREREKAKDKDGKRGGGGGDDSDSDSRSEIEFKRADKDEDEDEVEGKANKREPKKEEEKAEPWTDTDETRNQDKEDEEEDTGEWDLGTSEECDVLRQLAFASALCWREEERGTKVAGGDANLLNATHPVFNITITHTQGIMAHFYQQGLLPKNFSPPRPGAAGAGAQSQSRSKDKGKRRVVD
ncbi:hypothetical protein AX16_005882 [Volvariella volvacea WC 439]|nr:hypothetical protein AX16_005882 [Volvariella volvacea WC 439]